MDGSSFETSRSSRFEVFGAAVEDAGDDLGEELLGEIEQTVEAEPGDLGLDHPELGQVAAGLGLLGAEGRTEAVDLAEGRAGGLEVELAGLRQVGRFAEVVGLEQRRGALARGRRQDRRVDVGEAAVVEEVADGLADLVADPHHGVLAFGAQPQVAVVEQEVGAVVLLADGELGGDVDRVQGRDLELVAAGGAVVGDQSAGDPHRRLLGQLDRGLPDRLVDLGAEDDALQVAEAVAQDDEAQLALLAPVVDPALDGDFLVHVLGEIGDGDHGRRHRSSLSRARLYTRAGHGS